MIMHVLLQHDARDFIHDEGVWLADAVVWLLILIFVNPLFSRTSVALRIVRISYPQGAAGTQSLNGPAECRWSACTRD